MNLHGYANQAFDQVWTQGEGLQKAEQHTGGQRIPRAPFGKDQRGEGDKAASGSHVLYKARLQRRGKISARDATKHATDTDSRITQANYRDAGRVHRGRVFAHCAQAQAEAGAVQDPPGGGHAEQRDINEDGMA